MTHFRVGEREMIEPPKRITDELFVTVQPGKPDIARIADQGYRTLINNRPDGEDPGQLAATEARAEAERAGLAYVHLPVTTGAVSSGDVARFKEALRQSPKPVVAHCRSGTPVLSDAVSVGG